MKKFMLLVLVLTNSLIFAQTPFQPSGAGSSTHPYQITTLSNLYWIAATDAEVPSPSRVVRWSSYYVQTSDIEATETSGWFSGSGWSPIGNSLLNFSGNYDGQGYSITGLYINRPAEDDIGLFGRKNTGSVIRKLSLVQADIIGRTSVGGIAGYQNSSYIYDCSVSGNITCIVEAVGGILGYTTYGGLSGCSSSAVVTGGNLAGGLMGSNYSCGISDCSSSGSVTGNNNVGGLLGFVRSSVINCYATGSVTGVNYVGGLAGSMYSGWDIKKSYSTGNVRGYAGAGGFIGSTQYAAEISDCYSKGHVTRTSGSTDPSIAGFAGMNFRAKILRCYSTGSVTYEGTTPPANKGFTGFVDTGSGYQMTGNFWDKETSLQTSTAGSAAGKTTAEMKMLSTFSGAGWDFSIPVWKIVDTAVYPFLAWQRSSYITFEGGTSNGIDGDYPAGVILPLSAFIPPPGSGSAFQNWTDGKGTILSGHLEFDYTVTDQDLTIYANYETGSADLNLTITLDGSNVILDWNPLTGALYYRIFSSTDLSGTFTLDETGDFNGSSWIGPMNNDKKFYYVVTYN